MNMILDIAVLPAFWFGFGIFYNDEEDKYYFDIYLPFLLLFFTFYKENE